MVEHRAQHDGHTGRGPRRPLPGLSWDLMKTFPRRRGWAGRAFQKEEEPRQRLGTEPSTGARGASSLRQSPHPGAVWPRACTCACVRVCTRACTLGGKSLLRGRRAGERPAPGAGALSPATAPTGPDPGSESSRPRWHAPLPEFSPITQEARKSPDPECAQHGGR